MWARGQKHGLPETFINKDYANVRKFMKITSNSTQNKRQKTQKAQNDKKLYNILL